jgi:hypothetical protein
MTKRKYPYVDHTQRDANIIKLREKGHSYKSIMSKMGLTMGVVNAALKKDRFSGGFLNGDLQMRMVFLSHRLNGESAGRISTICEVIGIDGLRWILKSKPPEMTFAEFVGVLVKDAYLEETDK